MPFSYPTNTPDTTLSRLLGGFDPLDLVGGVGMAKRGASAARRIFHDTMEQLKSGSPTMRENLTNYARLKGGLMFQDWGKLHNLLDTVPRASDKALEFRKQIAQLEMEMDKLLGTNLSWFK